MSKSNKERFLAALGLISVNFQCLEKYMEFLAWNLISEDQEIGQIVTYQMSFYRLCDLLVSLSRHKANDSDLLKEIETVIKRAKEAVEERNRVIHSSWFGDLETSILKVKITAGRKTGFKHQSERINPDDLLKIANDIKQVWEDLIDIIDEAKNKGMIKPLSYQIRTPPTR